MTAYLSCKIKVVSMFPKDFSWKLCALSYNPSSSLLLSKFSSSCDPALQADQVIGSRISVDELAIHYLPRDTPLKLCLELYVTLSSFFLRLPSLQVTFL